MSHKEPAYQRAAKELEMLTRDALLRERYEARQKAIGDQISFIHDTLEDGCEQGREQGLERGGLIGRIQVCQQVLNQPVTSNEELTALSIEELRRYAENLQAELLNR